MGYLFTAGKGKSTTQKCRLAGDMLVLKKLITHQPGHHCIIDSSRDFPHVVRQPRSARSAHGTRFPLNSQNNGTWRHRKTSKTPWNNCGIQFRDDQISSKIMMISNSSPLETAKWAPNCQIVCNMSLWNLISATLLMLTLMNHTNHTWIATKTSLPTRWGGFLLGFSISKYVKRFRKKALKDVSSPPKRKRASLSTRPVFFQRPT